MSYRLNSALCLSLILSLLAGCSPRAGAPVAEGAIVSRLPSPRPITQVTQTINLSYAESWSTVRAIIAARGIQLASFNEDAGTMLTEWIPVTDQVCGVSGSSGAPLDCRVRYLMHFAPLTDVASAFEISYTQRCLDLADAPLECPDSNAERLMLQIVNDLKKIGGAGDRAR